MNPEGKYFLYAAFLRRYLWKRSDTLTRDWTENVLLGRFDTPQAAWAHYDQFMAMNKERCGEDFEQRIEVCVADEHANFFDR